MKKIILLCFIALFSLSVAGQRPGRTKDKRTQLKIGRVATPAKEEKKDSVKTVIMAPMPMTIATAVVYTAPKTYKLKITLTDVQCVASTDKDKIDDYGIQQHIYYKANGKIKRPISKDIKKFKDKCDDVIDDGALYLGELLKISKGKYNKIWEGANALLCGDYDNQLQVREGGRKRSPNVNNSMIFEITEAEYKDENAQMFINTTVTEYNSVTGQIAGIYPRVVAKTTGLIDEAKTYKNNNINYNYDGKKYEVSIRDVLDALTGVHPLKTTKPFFDSSIAKGILFDNFDGHKLPLYQLEYERKKILEGVIRARGKTSANKAAIWMRFELMD